MLYNQDNVGHIGALIQDENGMWWHYYWGTEGIYRILCVTGFDVIPYTWCKEYQGEPELEEINKSEQYPYQYQEMVYLVGDFSESVSEAKNSSGYYNLLDNNCAQKTINVLAKSKTEYQFSLKLIASIAVLPKTTFNLVKKVVNNKNRQYARKHKLIITSKTIMQTPIEY